MKKQTAVEWMYEQIKLTTNGEETRHEELLQVAKQMESEQTKASKFVRFVTPSHIETLDAWCEHTGKSAPKSIVQAIELARKYEQEMPALLDELKVWKLAVERRDVFFGGNA